jgi:hypothetical protein
MAIALFRKSSPYAIAFSSFCGGLDGNLAKLKIYSTQIQRRYIFTNNLLGHQGSISRGGPAPPRIIDATKTGFVLKKDFQG